MSVTVPARPPLARAKAARPASPGAIEARWTTERVLDAMWDWRARYGWLPTSYDWSRSRRRGGEALCDWSEVTGSRRARHERPWKLGRSPRRGLQVAKIRRMPTCSSATTAN